MLTTLCLVGSLLIPGQAPAGEWLLAPYLGRAQEFVYRGQFRETSLTTNTTGIRQYRVETRLFVLDADAKGYELGVLTTLRASPAPSSGPEPAPLSLRLEIVKVDAQGRLLGEPSGLSIPLDGPPTLEFGCFLAAPKQRLGVGQSWEVSEEHRPTTTWKVSGSESVTGTTCIKVVGTQQSDDWLKPRADRVGWQRQDTLWLSSRQGIAQKVERVLHRREPGRVEPTHKLELTYQLASTLQYPEKLYEERRLEIQHAKEFWEKAKPLLVQPGRHQAELEQLLSRIGYHNERNAPTPYREAILRVKQRIELAKKGEALVTVEEQTPTTSSAQIATVGKLAPDFLTACLTTGESTRLKNLLGKPTVLVFYNPTSERTPTVLQYCAALAAQHKDEYRVIALAMSEDTEKVLHQHRELKLKYPVLSGTGLRVSYTVEATPKVVVLDQEGYVKGSFLGWGLDVQEGMLQELKRCGTSQPKPR